MLSNLLLLMLAFSIPTTIISVEPILNKKFHPDGRKEFTFMKQLQRNQCRCSCSCIPQTETVNAATATKISSIWPFAEETTYNPAMLWLTDEINKPYFKQHIETGTVASAAEFTAITEKASNEKSDTIQISHTTSTKPGHESFTKIKNIPQSISTLSKIETSTLPFRLMKTDEYIRETGAEKELPEYKESEEKARLMTLEQEDLTSSSADSEEASVEQSVSTNSKRKPSTSSSSPFMLLNADEITGETGAEKKEEEKLMEHRKLEEKTKSTASKEEEVLMPSTTIYNLEQDDPVIWKEYTHSSLSDRRYSSKKYGDETESAQSTSPATDGTQDRSKPSTTKAANEMLRGISLLVRNENLMRMTLRELMTGSISQEISPTAFLGSTKIADDRKDEERIEKEKIGESTAQEEEYMKSPLVSAKLDEKLVERNETEALDENENLQSIATQAVQSDFDQTILPHSKLIVSSPETILLETIDVAHKIGDKGKLEKDEEEKDVEYKKMVEGEKTTVMNDEENIGSISTQTLQSDFSQTILPHSKLIVSSPETILSETIDVAHKIGDKGKLEKDEEEEDVEYKKMMEGEETTVMKDEENIGSISTQTIQSDFGQTVSPHSKLIVSSPETMLMEETNHVAHKIDDEGKFEKKEESLKMEEKVEKEKHYETEEIFPALEIVPKKMRFDEKRLNIANKTDSSDIYILHHLPTSTPTILYLPAWSNELQTSSAQTLSYMRQSDVIKSESTTMTETVDSTSTATKASTEIDHQIDVSGINASSDSISSSSSVHKPNWNWITTKFNRNKTMEKVTSFETKSFIPLQQLFNTVVSKVKSITDETLIQTQGEETDEERNFNIDEISNVTDFDSEIKQQQEWRDAILLLESMQKQLQTFRRNIEKLIEKRNKNAKNSKDREIKNEQRQQQQQQQQFTVQVDNKKEEAAKLSSTNLGTNIVDIVERKQEEWSNEITSTDIIKSTTELAISEPTISDNDLTSEEIVESNWRQKLRTITTTTTTTNDPLKIQQETLEEQENKMNIEISNGKFNENDEEEGKEMIKLEKEIEEKGEERMNETMNRRLQEEKERLEKARLLREEQMELRKQQQLNHGFVNKTQLERQEQIAQQLEQLAENERKHRERIEREERIRNARMKHHLNHLNNEKNLLPAAQCSVIRKFVNVFKISKPIEWIRMNCSIVKMYFRNDTCEHVQDLFKSCIYQH